MLLRTRITVMVSAVAVTLMGALATEGSLRARWLQEEMQSGLAARQRSTWNALQQNALQPLKDLVLEAERDGTLTGALTGANKAALAEILDRLRKSGGETARWAAIEVAGVDGRRTAGVGAAETVLSPALLSLLRGGGTSVAGLMWTDKGAPVLGAAVPLYSRSGFAGMIVAWTDAGRAVRELAATVGAEAVLADAHGKARGGAQPGLPPSVLDAVAAAPEGMRTVGAGGHWIQVVWAAVPVVADKDEVKVVAMTDITASKRQRFWSLAVSEGAVWSGAVLFLAFLYWYMRRSFRPLYRVIHMLTALARGEDPGETVAKLPDRGAANDEIGRLAATAAGFRTGLGARDQLLKLRQDLDSAAAIQTSILPPPPDARAEFALRSYMHPAREVGGDFYDFFDLPDGRFGMVIADVSGKGMGAALFMAVACTVIRSTAQLVADPGECLAQANDLLAANNTASLFVTVFYGILCPRTGAFVYANGGHNPPYRLERGGEVSALPRTGGALLGLFPGNAYVSASVTLGEGDSLFLYTDGVTEAQDRGGALFGAGRLENILAACGGKPERLVEAVLAAIGSFVADEPQADDITCLALHWTGGGLAEKGAA